MNNEYKLSGKSGNILIGGLLLGPLLMSILCFIYAYIAVYNPFEILNPLVFFFFLFGIILTQKFVIKLSKCRNINSSKIYGLTLGLFGVYSIWYTFLFALIRKENLPIKPTDLILNPNMIYELANIISVDRYYTLFIFDIKGGFLWIIWLIEALGIIGAGTIAFSAMMDKEVFCEDCNQWAKDIDFNLRLRIDSKYSAKMIIDTDITKILDCPIYYAGNSQHLKINIHQCSKCQNTSAIDVEFISYETDEKGEVVEKSNDFIGLMTINTGQFKQFIDKKNESNL